MCWLRRMITNLHVEEKVTQFSSSDCVRRYAATMRYGKREGSKYSLRWGHPGSVIIETRLLVSRAAWRGRTSCHIDFAIMGSRDSKRNNLNHWHECKVLQASLQWEWWHNGEKLSPIIPLEVSCGSSVCSRSATGDWRNEEKPQCNGDDLLFVEISLFAPLRTVSLVDIGLLIRSGLLFRMQDKFAVWSTDEGKMTENMTSGLQCWSYHVGIVGSGGGFKLVVLSYEVELSDFELL